MRVSICFVLLGSLVTIAGCSTTTNVTVPRDSGTGGEVEETEPEETDAATPPKQTKVGSACTAATLCSPGQSCMGMSMTGAAICLQDCKTSADCPNRQRCEDKVCIPSCDDGCPSPMTCFAEVGECWFDCAARPKLCGPSEQCDKSVNRCVPKTVVEDAGPDANPVTCAPGGGGATSGLNGTKTVGSLTDPEKGTFCDWASAIHGGYGCQKACNSSTARFAADRDKCIAQFAKPTCQATVAQAEACLKENAVDICAFKILSSPTCAELRACL